MLRKLTAVRELSLRATDGPLGGLHDCYFDDQRWVVRYLVVETAGWLGRRVLVSPIALVGIDFERGVANLAITREQVERSPDVDLHRPVSRQFEATHARYYGHAPYWIGSGLWAPQSYPGAFADGTLAAIRAGDTAKDAAADAAGSADSYLRSAREVAGYHIRAVDGEIGHVDDFVVDDRSWEIRYLEVDTSNWIGGTSVLVPRHVLRSVNWPEQTLSVGLTRDQVQGSPRLDTLEMDADQRLAEYYGLERAGRTTTLS